MRKLVVADIPRDQLPDLTDPRWRYWSRRLRLLMLCNPVDWGDLEAFGDLVRTSDMTVRNLLAYLEGDGYAASFRMPDGRGARAGKMVWCGCQSSLLCPVIGITLARCPKVSKVRR